MLVPFSGAGVSQSAGSVAFTRPSSKDETVNGGKSSSIIDTSGYSALIVDLKMDTVAVPKVEVAGANGALLIGLGISSIGIIQNIRIDDPPAGTIGISIINQSGTASVFNMWLE